MLVPCERETSYAQRAQFGDDAGERVDKRVDIGTHRRVPDGYTQRPMGVDTHRFEYGRRLERL